MVIIFYTVIYQKKIEFKRVMKLELNVFTTPLTKQILYWEDIQHQKKWLVLFIEQ